MSCSHARLREAVDAHNSSQVCKHPSAIHACTHMFIYGILYIYPGLHRMHPACTGRTGSPQHQHAAGMFPQVPRTEVHRLMHTQNSLQPWVTWIHRGHRNTSWTTHGCGHFPQCPHAQHSFARGLGGMLGTTALVWASYLYFPAQNQGFPLRMGRCIFAAHQEQPQGMLLPKLVSCQNKPQLMSLQHVGLLAQTAAHPQF